MTKELSNGTKNAFIKKIEENPVAFLMEIGGVVVILLNLWLASKLTPLATNISSIATEVRAIKEEVQVINSDYVSASELQGLTKVLDKMDDKVDYLIKLHIKTNN